MGISSVLRKHVNGFSECVSGSRDAPIVQVHVDGVYTESIAFVAWALDQGLRPLEARAVELHVVYDISFCVPVVFVKCFFIFSVPWIQQFFWRPKSFLSRGIERIIYVLFYSTSPCAGISTGFGFQEIWALLFFLGSQKLQDVPWVHIPFGWICIQNCNNNYRWVAHPGLGAYARVANDANAREMRALPAEEQCSDYRMYPPVLA